LSFVLAKLEISFTIFQESFEYYVGNKGNATAAEFSLIAKMQAKCRQEELKQIEADLGDKVLTKEQLLSIFEQLLKLENQVKTEFEEEEKVTGVEMDQEKMLDLQYKQVVSEAQFFDQLYTQRQIEEQAYFFSLGKMDVQNDPKFKAVLARFNQE